MLRLRLIVSLLRPAKPVLLVQHVAQPELGQQLIRLGRHVTFLDKANLLGKLSRIEPDTTLVVDGSRSITIDPDILSVIETFREKSRPRNIRVLFLRQAADYAQYLTGRAVASSQDEDFLRYYQLFAETRNWVAEKLRRQLRLASTASQQPRFLFIGHAEQAAASGPTVAPAKVFGGRAVPGRLASTDLDLAQVVQYAVEALQVQHIVVCGHYGSLATEQSAPAATSPARRRSDSPPTQMRSQTTELPEPETEQERRERLVQLHVVEQLYALQQMACVQAACNSAAPVQLHGWALDPAQGLLHDLGVDLRRDFSEYDTLFRYQVGARGLSRLPGELCQSPFLYAVSAGTPAGPVLAMPPLDTPTPLDEL